MNRDQPTTPKRTDIWKNATLVALIAAVVMLVLVKLLTGIMFVAALFFAVAVFMIAFGFALRLSSRKY